jgi:hypothetical protein
VLMGKTAGGLDHKSIGSYRSMASMSVSDRSHAERSKAEESLANQAKERRAAKKAKKKAAGKKFCSSINQQDHCLNITSIDEMSITDFSGPVRTSKSTLEKSCRKASVNGLMSKQEAIEESTSGTNQHVRDETIDSHISGSMLESKSVSARPKAEQSGSGKIRRQRNQIAVGETLTENEDEDESQDESDQLVNPRGTTGLLQGIPEKGNKNLDDSLELNDAVVPRLERNLRFRDGHSEKYISQEITHSMYDEMFYTAEELAQFRYEAFMEEAGLDINDFS